MFHDISTDMQRVMHALEEQTARDQRSLRSVDSDVARVLSLLAMSAPGERYVMPDLVYRNYDQVRPYFERSGFKFGNVKFERYEGVSAGVILRQFPLPGHPLTRDDSVSLVVATADMPEAAPPPEPAAEGGP